jgi:quinohemoprotein ethanol dehydrogenase
MRGSTLGLGIAAAVGLSAITLTACDQQKANWSKPAGPEWPMGGGDWGNTRFSSLKKIDTTNVKTLGGAWLRKVDAASSGFGGRGTPVIADGKMFISGGAQMVAINPATGEDVWTYKPAEGATARGVTIGEDKVFVGLSGARIAAVDIKTGKELWVGRVGDDPPLRGQAISSPPAYANGLVISGMANGDYGFRGRVVALDAKTGAEAWRFYAVPGPGEPGHETWDQTNEDWKRGGGGVWTTPAVDPALGMVYFGTGNPVPQFAGETRGGDNLYTDSAVALDLKTGKVKWHYQIVHHDIWEADLGTPLVLFDSNVGGKKEKAVGVMSTYGELFMLNRETGKPIWPVEERPVPQNAHQKTAATQPHLVGADQIGSRCVREDRVPEGFKAACQFEPHNYDTPNFMYPILHTRQAPMAYSPQTEMFYATSSEWPFWMKRFEDPWYFVAVPTGAGIKYSGQLTALDAKTNKIAWQKDLPYEIQNGGGVTATAGGLIFHGEPDGNLQAYNAKTGELLWQFQTGANANNPVATYEVKGEQYVSLATPAGIWAFKLGGTVQPLPAPEPPVPESRFAGRIVATEEITMSAHIQDTGLVDKVREAYDEYAFMPARAKVTVGTKVKFTNAGKETHTANALDGSWTTGPIEPGKSATVTFNKPGTYAYSCGEHPFSQAQLIVEE